MLADLNRGDMSTANSCRHNRCCGE
jgi:hypothetical protein